MKIIQKLICIDAGHGGKDNGAVYNQVLEDESNLSISFMLDYELKLMGYNTIMTREKDIDVSLSKRVKDANAAKADLFVSIHCDAWHNKTTSGMTVHRTPVSIEGTNCAESVADQLRLYFPDHRQRGPRSSKFYVLKYTGMPAILVECEFLSNIENCAFLDKPENQRRLAKAIAKGVNNYLL